MAEAIVGPLLSKLQEVVVTEATALAGVGGQIDCLRDKLMWLHALLQEIEQRSRHDTSRFHRVLSWQIREVALQAEDAIDQFYLEADLSRRGWRRAAKEFVTNFRTQVRVRFVLSRTIQSLDARLEEIINNSGKYGSVYTVQGSSQPEEGWKPSSDVPRIRHHWNWEDSEGFELIGLKREKGELMGKLMNGGSVNKAVIYVCGVSGTGKRALLRDVWEQRSIREHFDVCISASFPPVINEEGIVQQIRGMLVKECSLHKKTANQGLSTLRVMVLMNSPISIAKCSKVEPMLLKMVGQGSRIVMSATSVYEEMWSQHVIRLGHLDKIKSVRLFDYATRLNRGRRRSDQIVRAIHEVRDIIYEITKGLPLAVVLLAKLMITMGYSKWGTASSYIMRNKNETDPLKRILLVCIDDLPDELKSCLLYTAGFPENSVIDAKQLVRLWMAEGFLLAPQHEMEGEQLGQCYLKELIYRGLLQLIDKSSTSTQDGEVESVAIHELIHPFFRSEVRRTAFMYVHRSGRVVAPDDTRRLALQNYDNRFLPLGVRYSKLRTVVSFCYDEMDYLEGTGHDEDRSLSNNNRNNAGDEDQSSSNNNRKNAGTGHDEDQSLSNNRNITAPSRRDFISGNNNEPKLDMGPLLRGSQYLRVINLEGLDVGRVLPDEIGNMVHLRYLGIRCRLLEKIPSSIGNLRNLQTMDVRGTQVRRLPRSFWKIRTLRHVLGDALMFPSSSVSLESMHTLGTVILWDMTEWSNHVVRRGKRGLRFLQRLHVVGLNESAQLYLETLLQDLRCLESLILSGDVIPIDLFASASDHPGNGKGSLFSCLEHVASLELKGRLELANNGSIKKGPYNRCLSNLSRLVLRSTRVKQDFIDVIAKLPALAELTLLVDSYEGDVVVFCAQGFISLRVLLISGLVELDRIVGPDDTKRRMMNKTISATLIKMAHARYETHKDCRFCDSTKSQPPNTEDEEEPAARASASAGNNQAHASAQPPTGNSSQLEEITEEVQTGGIMNPNPVPITTSRSEQHKNQLETTDEAHDHQAKQSEKWRSEEEQDGKPTASEGGPMVSHRGTRRMVRRISVRSLSNTTQARVEGDK